jgi:hypothetical protein
MSASAALRIKHARLDLEARGWAKGQGLREYVVGAGMAGVPETAPGSPGSFPADV